MTIVEVLRTGAMSRTPILWPLLIISGSVPIDNWQTLAIQFYCGLRWHPGTSTEVSIQRLSTWHLFDRKHLRGDVSMAELLPVPFREDRTILLWLWWVTSLIEEVNPGSVGSALGLEPEGSCSISSFDTTLPLHPAEFDLWWPHGNRLYGAYQLGQGFKGLCTGCRGSLLDLQLVHR